MLSDYTKHKKKKSRARDVPTAQALDKIINEAKKTRKRIHIQNILENAQLANQKRSWMEELMGLIRDCDKLDWFENETVLFKPKYNISNKGELLKLLKSFEEKGLGTVLVNELEESYDEVLRDIDALVDEGLAYRLTVKNAKGDVLFYRRTDLEVPMDHEIVMRWRQVSMAALTEQDVIKQLKAAGKQPLRVETIKEEEDISDKRKGKRRRNKQDKKNTAEHLRRMIKK
eukprot:m.9944 g.9944  ORF g.9944 m.9944 type:complete len:229 (+) comp6468_c0_seq1:30-716(+)